MAFIIVKTGRAFLPFKRWLSPVFSKMNIECNLEKRDKVAGPADTDYLGIKEKARY